jgi:hypothetical protein
MVGTCRLTMLNSMASADFATALDKHVAWGLSDLDLKECIFGKDVVDLTDQEAARAAEMIRERGLSVWCMSTQLFHEDVEAGEAVFAAKHLGRVADALRVARILRPHFVRLLGAKTRRREQAGDCMDYLRSEHSWLLPMYAEAVDRIHSAGFHATVENEAVACILATPAEVKGFFAGIGRPGKVCFTWDAQNLWQMGTFPTMAVYEELRPLIGYYHVKGGQTDGAAHTLVWRSSLEEASWHVAGITRRVIADGVSPVICLNGSHGKRKPDARAEDVTQGDLGYLKALVAEGGR